MAVIRCCVFPLFQIDMTSSELRGEVSEAGKNRRQIVCVRCQSKILPPGLGTFQEIECQLQEKLQVHLETDKTQDIP